EVHGAELARADEEHPQRPAFLRTAGERGVKVHWLTTRSIVTVTPEVPGATGSVNPSRSPGCATGLPLFETRAPTPTRVSPESFAAGVIAMLSSSRNSAGRSRTRRRVTARGRRDPAAARAKMKTVSSGAARPASAGARRTVPVMRLASAVGSGFAPRRTA